MSDILNIKLFLKQIVATCFMNIDSILQLLHTGGFCDTTTPQEITTNPSTTSSVATTPKSPSKEQVETTSAKTTTTKPKSSTTESTPTQKATIVSTDKTQQPCTSTLNETDVVDNIYSIIDPVVIGVGIAVISLTILGILIVCLTVYYRRQENTLNTTVGIQRILKDLQRYELESFYTDA
ncbi:unnamed protein product [Mytilus edulis]|uniref:Uncharacterized protein n=1 Tax=Mytilus edulis TaxID=6550 RepID=A0A8S3U7F6_MYTED|nr:unnamed protein product [Mytilus edulis]